MKFNVKVIRLVLLLSLLGGFSCKDQEKEDLQDEVAKLKRENKELEEKISELEDGGHTPYSTVAASPISFSTPEPVFKTYAFAIVKNNESVMRMNENGMYYENETVTYVTNVNEFSNYSDEIKYKIRDEARESLCRFALNACDIKNIDIKTFDSYAEASKAREAIPDTKEIKIYVIAR